MTTPNVVPEGHVCSAPAIVPDCTDYTCSVCGRQWLRYLDPVTKDSGSWREKEPGYPTDTETGRYWSGPTLDLVQRHWHSGQAVVARAEVEPYPGRHVAGTRPTFFTLTQTRDNPDRYSVYRFWRGPEANWACTMLAEQKPYHEAVQEFQKAVGTTIAGARGE